MSSAIKLAVKPRAAKGSAAMRRLRRQGLVPGIVYGKGDAPRMIELNAHEFGVLLHQHASEHLMFDLCVGEDASQTVILEEVQRDAIDGSLTHLDFRAIAMDAEIEVEVGIELKGIPAGVKQQGGVLEHILHSLVVRCLPGDLKEVIELDVSALEIGDSLTVGDLPLDREKFTFRLAEDVAVATVAAPRVQEETEEEAEEAAGDEQPELVKGEEEQSGEEPAAGRS